MSIKALREEYAQVFADTKKALAETEGKFSAEQKEQQDRRYARLDEIKAQVAEQEKNAAYAFATEQAEIAAEPKGKVESERAAVRKEFTAADYRKAVNEFLTFGEIRSRELFATITTTGSSAFLPSQVGTPVVVQTASNPFKAAKALYGSPLITLGNTVGLKIPVWDDSANVGATKTEGATVETTPVDATATGLDLNCVLKESKGKWFSNSLLNANGFDLLAYASPQLFASLERAKHVDLDTAVKAAVTGMTTTAASTAITYNEWLTFEHSMPIAYRYNMALVVSDSAYRLLRGLVDSGGKPIMDNDPQNVFQKTIHGIPIFVSEYMSAVAATNKVAALVNVDCIHIREEAQRITKYVNVPQYPDQFGLNIFQDFKAAADNSGVRVLRML